MDRGQLVEVLNREFVRAVGCTEPAAIALTTATAYHAIGGNPLEIDLSLSTNVLKNAWAVGIPGTNDTGIDVAALLGVVVNRADAGLELLSFVSDRTVDEMRRLKGRCKVNVRVHTDMPGVYIHARVLTDSGTAAAQTLNKHSFTRLLEVNGAPASTSFLSQECDGPSLRSFGSLPDLIPAITSAPASDLAFLVERAELNLKMAEAGLRMGNGLGVRVLKEQSLTETVLGPGLANRLALYAAVACDARMAGIQRPVATYAGSGNLGITATVPLLLTGRELHNSWDATMHALAVSLTTTLYIKEFLGRLSPICGCAVGAGGGVSAGLAYLFGGGLEAVAAAVTNTVATLAGVLCDGGKVGCSLKVWSSVMTACQAALLAVSGKSVPVGNGVVGQDLEKTLSNLATVSLEGMPSIDRVLVSILQEPVQNNSEQSRCCVW